MSLISMLHLIKYAKIVLANSSPVWLIIEMNVRKRSTTSPLHTLTYLNTTVNWSLWDISGVESRDSENSTWRPGFLL